MWSSLLFSSRSHPSRTQKLVPPCFVATNELPPLQATVPLHLDNSSSSSLCSMMGSLVVTDHLFAMLSSTVVAVLIVGIKPRCRVSPAPP
ncbi:hypothetical protein Bca4012_039418 [Brassica carinata]